MRRRTFAGLALAALATPAVAAPLEALFAPRARLWERWTRHDPGSSATVDHTRWQAFLSTYVRGWTDGTTRVSYGAVIPKDRVELAAYLEELAATPVGTLRRDEQRAFWINLYNALTVKVVLDAYPVASIRDIGLSRGLFTSGPWDAKLITVDGEALTLNDIEHRILRPIWRDARIHYAVNCASIGCPNLSPTAFTAGPGEATLDAAAHAYVNDHRGVHIDPRLAGLIVSKIYGWFVEDFGAESGVISHLLHYADPELASRIRAAPKIADYRYDWALNDAR